MPAPPTTRRVRKRGISHRRGSRKIVRSTHRPTSCVKRTWMRKKRMILKAFLLEDGYKFAGAAFPKWIVSKQIDTQIDRQVDLMMIILFIMLQDQNRIKLCDFRDYNRQVSRKTKIGLLSFKRCICSCMYPVDFLGKNDSAFYNFVLLKQVRMQVISILGK